jgi:transcriptional regulator with XRE-family HTH domain
MEQTAPPAGPLARVVNSARESCGLSWRQLADEAAIPKTTLNRFTRGARSLTIPELERIAAVLGLKASELQAQAEDVAA